MKYIKIFFEESSIHGVPYLVNHDRHAVEKLLWGLAILLSLSCCGILIYEIGVKYKEDMMVTYTSETSIAVIDVSFKDG